MSEVLDSAKKQTLGPRQSDYGHPGVNLGTRTAALFAAYVQGMSDPYSWTATDVCNIMILLKIARLQERPHDPHFDSLVDIAGYASSAWRAAHEHAAVAEQADAPDSNSGPERGTGSIPVGGTRSDYEEVQHLRAAIKEHHDNPQFKRMHDEWLYEAAGLW